jgi:AcrR family transcriptional regulator
MQRQGGSEPAEGVLDPTAATDADASPQRQRIVDAMVASCAEKTYAATTIADLVSRASISRTTFYKQFDGKRECFDAALDWAVGELRRAAANSCSASDPPAEAVHKAAAATLRLMAAKPALAQLVMGEAIAVEPDAARRYRRLLIPALERLWEGADQPPSAGTDPRLWLGRAQVLIYNQILAGRTAELLDLLPEIVYIGVLPFAGHEEALRQARLAGSDPSPSPGDRRP